LRAGKIFFKYFIKPFRVFFSNVWESLFVERVKCMFFIKLVFDFLMVLRGGDV